MSSIISNITEFFGYIGSCIQAVFHFLGRLLNLLTYAADYVKVFLSIFPVWLEILLVVLVLVCILLKVLGREGAS